MKMRTSWLFAIAIVGSAALASAPAVAQKQYGPGASDTSIKIGSIMPYSGAVSAYSAIGKAEAAYFNTINVKGGINGRIMLFGRVFSDKASGS